jgi:hypothetical protein
MSAVGPEPPAPEFEAFGVAVGAAIVSGALSLIAPFLVALTGALAALALAGWISRQRHRGTSRRDLVRVRTIVASSFLALGVGVFLASPPALLPFRGLVLAAGLLPLWATERGRSARLDPREMGR